MTDEDKKKIIEIASYPESPIFKGKMPLWLYIIPLLIILIQII